MQEKTQSPEKRLQVIRDYISRMPSLSTTAMKVAEICNNPRTSPADLNRIISLDPILTGRVLRLVNSAYYGLSGEVASLTRAIIMLGLNTVVNLAISTAVVEKVSVKDSTGPLSVDAFWTHSLCVGVAAKLFSRLQGISAGGQEEYFVAGLLHDLGKVALNGCYPKEYQQVFERSQQEQKDLSTVESEVFGVDHSAVGRMIAERWQLGSPLQKTLAHHHHPEAVEENGCGPVRLVFLGDLYANRLQMGSPGYPMPEESAVFSAFEKAGINPAVLADYEAKVREEMEKARVFIQVSTKG